MNSDLLNTLAVNVFPLVVAAAVACYQFVMQFLPQNKHDQLNSLTTNLSHIAETTVNAVEQFMGSEAGPVKKAAAANDISAILNATGIRSVPPELIDNAIEAAVYSMNLFKPVAPSAAIAPAPTAVAPASPVASEAIASSVATPQPVADTSAS